MWWEFLLGLALGAILAWVGYRQKLLARSGIISMIGVSVLIFGLGGWTWGILPTIYFVSAGLWSRYAAAYKATLNDRFAHGLTRGWGQIVASVGWGVMLALLHWLAPSDNWIFVAFVGATATICADTWATELGVLSSQPPRLITTRQRTLAGTPGAISNLGIVAALAGAWLIGFSGLLLAVLRAWILNIPWDRTLLWLPICATLGGVAGSIVDSLLGATAQGLYYCERCEKQTEYRIHSCGEEARQIRGWSWLTNDGVNWVSSVVGAAVTAGVVVWLAQTNIWW